MTIDLPQELEERARAKVAAGEYSSVAGVVRAGLEALEMLENEEPVHDDAFLATAQQRWAEGDAAVARGDYFEGSSHEIMEPIRAKAGNPASVLVSHTRRRPRGGSGSPARNHEPPSSVA